MRIGLVLELAVSELVKMEIGSRDTQEVAVLALPEPGAAEGGNLDPLLDSVEFPAVGLEDSLHILKPYIL
jgi:hypothetical protein